MKSKIATVRDWGKPKYLDGAQMQYAVYEGGYFGGKMIAYVGDKEHAEKIAKLFGSKVVWSKKE